MNNVCGILKENGKGSEIEWAHNIEMVCERRKIRDII
jgi:hypothetical protein